MIRLADIFFDSLRPLKFVTIWLYLLAGVGVFMRSDDRSGDVHLLFHVAPVGCWLALFAFMAVSRVVGLWWWVGNRITRRATPIVGIVLWSFLFVSSAVAANFGLGTLYLVAALLEVWFLSRSIIEGF